MKELSLFTGAGGGLLGTKLLGWDPIGYVEWNRYAQHILRRRIADGHLPDAPIFGDIREFNTTYAREYFGLVDVVSGGFPCQPFSVAGRQRGVDDPRNMWPATIDTIRRVRPKFAFLENVPALLSSGYFGTVLGDLAESGYDARWKVISAEELGAPHKRERLWIVAYNNSVVSPRGGGSRRQDLQAEVRKDAEVVEERNGWELELGAVDGVLRVDTYAGARRMVHGIPNYVDRIRALGNAQVPIVAAVAWKILAEDLEGA